ncbi:MAG TPA: O-antigen ligase family protein [Burkholderiales bacterium]
MTTANESSGAGRCLSLSLMMAALGCYLMFSPIWIPSLTARMYDNARVLELILLILLVPLSLAPCARETIISFWARFDRSVRWCMAVLVVGGGVSAAFSDAPAFGIQQIALTMLLGWLFLSVCAIVWRLGKQAEMALAAATCAGAGLVVLSFWATFIQALELGRNFSWVSPFLEFANVRFFGQYQAYALLLVTLPIALARLTWSWRAIVYFVAANFWALQWMVASRAVWVGFAAAAATAALLMRAGRLRWLGEQGALVLAGGAIYVVFSSLVLSTPNATQIPAVNSIVARGGESTSERVTMAKAALRLIGEHPLAGVGPGQFGLHFSATGGAHPHNTPLQLLTEYGLPAGMAGIALGAMLVLFAAGEFRKSTMHRPDAVTASLAAALIMGLVDALFSGNLIMPHSQVLLCVIAGWLTGRSALSARAPAAAFPHATRVALTGAAILAALTASILGMEYLDVIRDMQYPPALRAPSFWQYGRFADW